VVDDEVFEGVAWWLLDSPGGRMEWCTSEAGEAVIDDGGGRLAVTVDGRTVDGRMVEYFVYGSPDPRADVVVNMHGSALEARFEMELFGNQPHRTIELLGGSAHDRVVAWHSSVR
jgi:hypothetical protein